jgi:hypothetical protein
MTESESYAPTAKDRSVHKADVTKSITMQPSQMTVPGKLPCSDDRPLDDRYFDFASQRLRWPERALWAAHGVHVLLASSVRLPDFSFFAPVARLPGLHHSTARMSA